MTYPISDYENKLMAEYMDKISQEDPGHSERTLRAYGEIMGSINRNCDFTNRFNKTSAKLYGGFYEELNEEIIGFCEERSSYEVDALDSILDKFTVLIGAIEKSERLSREVEAYRVKLQKENETAVAK